MINNEKENYFENSISSYLVYQSSLLTTLNELNTFQHNLGFREFYDITIRCTNALSRSIKYFRDNNINYYDKDLKNTDRALMVVIETYICSLLKDAFKEYNDYLTNVNDISDGITKTAKFKLYKKFNKANKLNLAKYYENEQDKVDNFYKIGDKITSFEVEKNINDAIYQYLPIFHDKVFKLSFNNDIFENFRLQSEIYHLQISKILLTLTKLNILDEIVNIAELEHVTLNNDIEEFKQKVLIKN